MTPDLLAVAGEALFGSEWRRALAAALGVDPRLVQRWAGGQREIPGTVAPALLALLGREASGLEGRALAMRRAAAAIAEAE
ncbi:hypothetical protein [Methylobacterium platani]|uniref:Uncharacterized protein n=2 Tax=Methylobacterium platani TaxID=427683 RepID=A0A179SD49_9HYPH|nr:hypothetical protein [Methylobacterium platani]KMO15953.1 hypothetical protein SQ03_15910 [Methylobacterium platani JCM 14648]OAS24893.1 hypothetical protein A5481_12435 [Methylobacterium platani]